MKKLFCGLWVLLAGFFLMIAGAFAKGPVQDKDAEDRPAEGSVSDIEGLSNRINDLAKSARVGLLLQVQYTNTGGNALLPKGFSTPLKTPASGFYYFDQFSGKRAEIGLIGDLQEKK